MHSHTSFTTLGGCGFCLEGPPLQLIVQHACANSEPADVCNLMLVSKALHQAVVDFCKGSLQVKLVEVADVLAVQPFAAWLAQCGPLLSSIEFGTAVERYEGTTEQERSAMEQTLASALQQAAASTATSCLQLRSCTLVAAGTDIGAVLQQLPVATLTSLDLGIVQPDSNQAAHSDYLSPLNNSISHLTNLRSLNLQFSAGDRDSLIGLDPVLQQVTALVQLTSLSISEVNDDEALQYVPASIKVLSFSWAHEADDTQLRLGHLTALTRLSTGSWLPIPEQTTLPTSLMVLELTDMYDGACLMPLEKLRKLSLDMHDGEFDATYPQLSALGSLSHVELTYEYGPGSTAGAAWHALPLRYLRASHLRPQDLAGLTQLTGLTLGSCRNCTSAELAEALQTLTNLQVFSLGPGDLEAMFIGWKAYLDGSNQQHALVIYKALCSLKRLFKLCLHTVHASHEAAELLASSIASRLVHVEMVNCELDNNSLGTILSNSKHLQYLDVRGNRQVDNEILPIVAQLRKLKYMGFDCTGITRDAFARAVPKVSYLRSPA